MEPEIYWELFCATGDPMAYMLYRGAEEDDSAEDEAEEQPLG